MTELDRQHDARQAPARATTESPENQSCEMELYRLAVEMADRVSARRGAANGFFLTLQTSLLAFGGIAAGLVARSPWFSAGMCLVGLSLSLAWWLQLVSYRDLNRAKFSVILDLEERLPYRVYGREWEALTRPAVGRMGLRYVELGRVERVIPLVFGVLHVVSFVGRVVG